MKKCILTNTDAKIQRCVRTHKSFSQSFPFTSNILSHIKNTRIPRLFSRRRSPPHRHLTDSRKGTRTRRMRSCRTSARGLRGENRAMPWRRATAQAGGHMKHVRKTHVSLTQHLSARVFCRIPKQNRTAHVTKQKASFYPLKGKLSYGKRQDFTRQKARIRKAEGTGQGGSAAYLATGFAPFHDKSRTPLRKASCPM